MFSQIIFIIAVAHFASASVSPGVAAKATPKPYSFGYKIKDESSEQYRQESGDGTGLVIGSYGFTDAKGIKRQVNYIADGLGFRAQVNTNEPGTANQSPAAVEVNSNAPNAGKVAVTGLEVRKKLLPIPKSVDVRKYSPSSRYRYGTGNGLGVTGLRNYIENPVGYGYDRDFVNFGYGLENDVGALEYGFGSNLVSPELVYGNGLGSLDFGYGYDFRNSFGYNPFLFGNIGF